MDFDTFIGIAFIQEFALLFSARKITFTLLKPAKDTLLRYSPTIFRI